MSDWWIKQEIRLKHLPVVRLGRMVRIDEADLDAYIQKRKSAVVETVGSECRMPREGAGGQFQQVIETTVTTK